MSRLVARIRRWHTRWGALLPILVVEFVVLLGFGALLPVLPLYVVQHGVDLPTLGLIIGAWAIAKLGAEPFFGWLSDRIGRRPMYILGALFTIAFAFPLFWMLESKSVALIITAVIVAMNFGHGMMFGPESAYFPELFGARVRYSGASFGFQVSAALGGGFSPIIATAMVGYFGGTTGVSVMMIILALITLAAALAARETKGEALT